LQIGLGHFLEEWTREGQPAPQTIVA
jgi:hypothetical protein